MSVASMEVDLAVIGAGPAGQKGAIQGAKAGKRVVVIDRLGLLGGACLNQGTIPSKTLRRAILDLTGYLQSAYYGQARRSREEVSISDLTFEMKTNYQWAGDWGTDLVLETSKLNLTRIS